MIVCGGKESNEGSSEHKPPSHAALQGNVTSTCNVKQEFAGFLKVFKTLSLKENCQIRIAVCSLDSGSDKESSKHSGPRVSHIMAVAPIWKSRNLNADLFYGHDFVIN